MSVFEPDVRWNRQILTNWLAVHTRGIPFLRHPLIYLRISSIPRSMSLRTMGYEGIYDVDAPLIKVELSPFLDVFCEKPGQ